MLKTLALLAIASLASSCAYTKTEKINDTTYSISCFQSHPMCAEKAAALCGTSKYKVTGDTLVNWCDGAQGTRQPCAWKMIVECGK